MWLRNLYIHSPPKTMFAQSFPPADAFLKQVSSIEYKKHLQQFVMITATVLGIIVGVAQFLYNKVSQWYNNGGKEQLIVLYHQTRKVSVQVYIWVLNEFVPMMQKMYQGMHKQLIILGVVVPV